MTLIISLVLTALLVGVDQWTKWLAVTGLKDQPPIVLWENVFELQYCENRGMAFSLMQNQRWIFIAVTGVAIAVLLVVLVRSPLCKNLLFRISCVLILAGAVGNLIDRTALGFVVDFLYVKAINFPVFNFADCFVTVGAVCLFVYVLFLHKSQNDTPLTELLFGIKKQEETNGRSDD